VDKVEEKKNDVKGKGEGGRERRCEQRKVEDGKQKEDKEKKEGDDAKEDVKGKTRRKSRKRKRWRILRRKV
jgi:hypothetical protein